MTLAPVSAQQLLPELLERVEALESAGIGALSAQGSNLPLRRVAIRSRVSGMTCETTVAQVFANPHREFVEATYIFPLPGRFAVTDCTMRVGGRVIKAELQERSQARATYNQAIAAGHRASIAEEERSETFTLRVGNIPPLEEVAVELTLVGEISVADGEGTLRIPLVVAPRYVPGQPLDGPGVGLGTAQDTDESPDASRITPPTLLPGFPNPVALSLEVELHPSPSLANLNWRESVRASLHSVLMSDSLPLRIRLIPGERLNRDFILRFPVLPPETDAVAEYVPGTGKYLGTFAVTLFPPAKSHCTQPPRDVVFVLDKSGSMSGWKIVAARRALARMIDTLRDTDRFRVIAFSSDITSPQKKGTDWQVATDRERWQAAEWTAKIEAQGGTELAGALRSALQPFATFGMPADRDAVMILITDGQVAGEDSVLRTIESLHLPRVPRILTLGIDRSVNAGLLTRLADLGGGAFELVETEQRLDAVLERFHHKLAAPLLTDVAVDAIEGEVLHATFTPAQHRQVCADRPLTIYGRCAGDPAKLRLRVIARDAAGGTWQQDVTAARTDSAALLPLWGRGRVRELEDQYARGTGETSKLQQQIVATSLESHILSRFTAYVAVDLAEVVNKGGQQEQIVQPVETPEGWAADSVPIQRKLSRVRASRSEASATGLPPTTLDLDEVIRASKASLGEHVTGAAKRLSAFVSNLISPSLAPPAKVDPPTAGKVPATPSADEQARVCELIPESVARENTIVPIAEKGDKLVVRMSDPSDLDTIEKLRFILNRPIEAVGGSATEIQETIDQHYVGGDGDSSGSMLMEFTDTAIDFTEDAFAVQDSLTTLDENSSPVIRLVNLMLAEAVQLRASHIVLQPEANDVRVQYLCEGALHERDRLPRGLYSAVVSRLCILGKLTIGSDGLEQGTIKVCIGDKDVDVRLYLIPTPAGRAVVLRLVCKTSDPLRPETAQLLAPWLAAAEAASAGQAGAKAILDQLRADCSP
jgi:Ca-activated chloride channel family protein